MSKDIDLQKVVSVLPQYQQRWIGNFFRHDIREVNLSNPDPNPGTALRGFYGRKLAGAMIASEALMKEDKDSFAQIESLLGHADAKKASSAIATGMTEIKAFTVASNAAENAGLKNVASAVDYAVIEAVSRSNPSVAKVMHEAESRPKLDMDLVRALIDMPVNGIVLLNEAEAAEKAMMAMSYSAALYVKYFGVLWHLAGRRFSEWEIYARPVRAMWELFKKGYVFIGTAQPEAVAGEMSTPYVCAMLRRGDESKGNGEILEI